MTRLQSRDGNRHLVDRLADIREQIRQLEHHEQTLRAAVLARPDDLTGDEFKAEIRHAEQRHLDAQAVIRHYGRTALAPFFKAISFDIIRLRRRAA
jgi:hypothetical protein